ncbi:metalloregulator ArsR/SmtB family transcription factor [Pseudogemmatithrix spongiicola]|uniref:Metalloregulator ArsR/SmtB family transcription factor n=1 Tax=Pseudogemmatithrix spongiicola TaxID=3062599 RepID=A0AA49JXT7_9BACT|nr:metalloregulator ArsR/SmtB family transcription factor [Gemmatimonadaceae bacterium 'strain 138']WKW13849.1 metalloregulator ArsR/SmtB family transcription factor [Gemmatimonadaceae bacterium 'strain 318']
MAHRTMTPAMLAEVAERFKALGEPVRLSLLQALRKKEMSVGELVAATGLGQANVSKHLHQLLDCGYVTRRKEGTFVYYRIASDDVFMLCDVMCSRIDEEVRMRRERIGR